MIENKDMTDDEFYCKMLFQKSYLRYTNAQRRKIFEAAGKEEKLNVTSEEGSQQKDDVSERLPTLKEIDEKYERYLNNGFDFSKLKS